MIGGDICRELGGFLGVFVAHGVINVGISEERRVLGQSMSNSVRPGDLSRLKFGFLATVLNSAERHLMKGSGRSR